MANSISFTHRGVAMSEESAQLALKCLGTFGVRKPGLKGHGVVVSITEIPVLQVRKIVLALNATKNKGCAEFAQVLIGTLAEAKLA